MKYIIYARKSTEEDDRQVLSIEAQLVELREFAAKEKLEIVASFQEAKTAKEPVKNIGSNHILRNREFLFALKTPYDLVAERSEATSESLTFPIWCAGEDLNLHALSGTGPSSLRVCRFHHPRAFNYSDAGAAASTASVGVSARSVFIFLRTSFAAFSRM